MVVERSPEHLSSFANASVTTTVAASQCRGSALTQHLRNVLYNAAVAGGVVLMKFKKRRGEL